MRKSIVRRLMDKLDPPFWHGVPISKEWTCFGYLCRITHSGWYCGYVALPANHPLILNNIPYDRIKVHGGITYTGLEGNLYWIGFDCAHAGDEIVLPNGVLLRGHHWTLEEVTREVRKLARQLKRLEPCNWERVCDMLE